VWDTVDAIVNFVDIGFVLHGEPDININTKCQLLIGCSCWYRGCV
jgi:hypothetical protein